MNIPAKNNYPSMAHMQKMFDLSPDIICTFDIDGRFVNVSRASIQVLGYHPDELIGKSYIEFLVEDDFQRTKQSSNKVMKGAVEINFQNRYYHKNGSIVSLSWSGQWDPEEKLMFCIARDDSERKAKEMLMSQLDQKALRSNLDMNEMLELITDGFMALNKNWQITHITPRIEKIFPIQREQLLNKSYWQCFPEMKGSVYEQQFNKAISSQKPVHFNGYFPPFRLWLEVDAYPSHVGLSIFFRDITTRKKEEDELRKLSLVAEHTNNIIAISSPDRKITWVNDAFSRVTGYCFEEVIGKTVEEVFDGPETDQEIIQKVKDKITNMESVQVEAINYKKNGETYWADISCHPIFDEHGVLKQYFSIAIDISERKKAEEELEREREIRQRKIAAAVIEAQEREQAHVSRELHDNVNQVLTTVKLYAELCRDGIGDTKGMLDKTRYLLQECIDEIRSLSKRLSAPSLGSIKLKESIKDLVDTVAATDKIRVIMETSGIEDLEVNQEVHLAIYRILQEQLTNVLRHAQAGRVLIELSRNDNNLYLQVTDDGKGFDTKLKREGIGLTNMSSRAENIGGTLTIQSAPGAGCKLLVSIPLI